MSSTIEIQEQLSSQHVQVEGWFQEKYEDLRDQGVLPPIYASFDVRDSGFKASVVDSNAFPAGFNNLNEDSRTIAAQQFREFLPQITESTEILLLLEDFSRNTYYFSNIRVLKEILAHAGYHAILGILAGNSGAGTKRAQDAEGNFLWLEHISRSGNKLQTNSFEDGLVILNNDFSLGRPEILEDLDQNVLPPTELGWHTRRKSRHFTIFNALVEDLAAICSFDPWFLKCEFLAVDGVNFVNSVGLETSSQAVDVVLNKISEKYAEYNLSEVPFVMMKDDSGTFGYGVQSIHSGEEILQMGAKTRKKFAVGKQKKPITSLLIQEGIPTSFSIDDQAAEPVIYSVGGHLVGGFMRIHPFQGIRGNLNSRGMFFGPLLDSPLTRSILSQEWKIFSLYNILNKLGNLAISYEQAESTASRRQI